MTSDGDGPGTAGEPVRPAPEPAWGNPGEWPAPQPGAVPPATWPPTGPAAGTPGPTLPGAPPSGAGQEPPGAPGPYGAPRIEPPGSVTPYGAPGTEPPGPPAPYGVPRQGGRRSRVGKGAGAAAAGGAAIAGKAGILGKLLLALKGLAVLGKFKFALSMVASVWVYAVFWGWQFALGFVLLLLVHELGHVVVLRAQGVPASAPVFIPFFGAFVSVKGPQRSVAQEAWSALAGPIAGLLAAVVCLQLADLDHSLLLRALAHTGFLITLFNLVPALPLDGGRVAGALHPAVWGVGMAVAVVLLLLRPSPVLFFVLIFGGLEAWRRWRERRAGQVGDYYRVPAATRLQLTLGYVAVAVACFWGMQAAYVVIPA